MDTNSQTMTESEFAEKLKDRYWRLNNLYWVVNEKGKRVIFKMRPAQEQFYWQMAYRNVIAKSRQHGITTLLQIMALDLACFNPNSACGVVAHELGAASEIFRTKIKFPYDNLPETLKTRINGYGNSGRDKPLKNKDGWLILGNGSSVRVSTSMRSGTLQWLHVSELGKICATAPRKAEEIRTGCLNAVHEGSFVFYESTAEGDYGYFYETCSDAQKVQETIKKTDRKLHPLEFKLHFFGWHEKPENRTDPELVVISKEVNAYLDKMGEVLDYDFDAGQRAWYELTKNGAGGQKHKMTQEHPTTMQEAFESLVENAYYGEQMAIAADSGRITLVPYDSNFPVYTAWDLGIADSMCIWYFQVVAQELRVLEYYENNNHALPHYIREVKSKEYVYEKHFAPHDINVRELSSGLSRLQIARKLGLRFTALPATRIEDGIDAVRNILPRCYFDINKTEHGVKCLRNYRKDYNDKMQRCEDKPCHDWASHGADAFRYVAVAYKSGKVDGIFHSTSLEHKDANDVYDDYDPLEI